MQGSQLRLSLRTMRKELCVNQELFPAVILIFFIKLASRFIKKGFSLPSGLGVWVKIIAFTYFRKTTETKEVSFEMKKQLNISLSVFSEESYIFGNK
ncbi:MAG: hypothetical protein Q7T12_05595 [Flavobacterium sp.]|nr:hypothetical protein [Flavobacterium sp.]